MQHFMNVCSFTRMNHFVHSINLSLALLACLCAPEKKKFHKENWQLEEHYWITEERKTILLLQPILWVS